MSDSLRLQDGSTPDAYFVDLDGTLLSTSSEKHFLVELLRRGMLRPSALFRFMATYALHPFVSLREGKGWNRSYLRNMNPEKVTDLAEACAEELTARNLRQWTVSSIGELSSAGSHPIILSASLSPIVRRIAGDLGIDEFRASDPEITGGVYTGRLSGTRPWGRGKLLIAEEWCRSNGTDLNRCAAAGDSWPDRHLLQACGCPVAVCPDRRLRGMARERGWKTVECSHTRFA